VVFGSASRANSVENWEKRYQDITGNLALTEGSEASG
jgi:hypothetical protein